MDPKHTGIETITKAVGRWNSDFAAGWATGLQGCTGDVRVLYFEGSTIIRSVNCGI
jgi:hypothetical protein